MILDTLSRGLAGAYAVSGGTSPAPSAARETAGELHWQYAPAMEIPRKIGDVLVETWVREPLLRLNPEIAHEPERADEVLYKLRAIPLAEGRERFESWWEPYGSAFGEAEGG